MPSINLAPGTQFIVEARRRRRRLFFLSGLIAAVAILVWAGMFFYNRQLQQQQADLAERIRNVQLEIAKQDEDAKRIVLFEERLKALDILLDQHISWNVVLSDLERLIPADVVLTRLEVNSETGGLSLTGLTPDIDRVSLALASLVENTDHVSSFKDGKLFDVRRQETRDEAAGTVTSQYVFTAELSFQPSILKQNQ